MGADSRYKKVNDGQAAVEANAGMFKASCAGQDGIWHLAPGTGWHAQRRQHRLGPAPWVPSNGAAPGLQNLAAGGMEVLPCALPEPRSLIDAGKLRSLAVMNKTRSALFPDVSRLNEATGSDWATGAWAGIAGPKGQPASIAARLVASV